MLSVKLHERAEKFRKEFQSWLQDNPPPVARDRVEMSQFVEVSTEWQRKLAEGRWIAVHWPEEFGGRGLSLAEEAIGLELLAKANSPQLINLFGLSMVGPVLIAHGSSEQKRRFLPKILSADEIWCQGFSEPEAGSDLASLKTTAVRDESHPEGPWVINGQKVWTSFAQYAQWCFVLVRTDSEVPRHKGLSYLLVPMSSDGISVRPLTQISGDQEFNEVFFEDVETPGCNIVGEPGDGWKIAISTLMYERVVLTFARHLQSEVALDEVSQVLCETGSSEYTRTRFGELISKNLALRALALNHLLSYTSGAHPGPEGSLDKLVWSETFQEVCEFALSALGAQSIFTAGPTSVGDGLHQHRYLYSRGRTIAAGTSEIQRNIIAERVLDLPRR